MAVRIIDDAAEQLAAATIRMADAAHRLAMEVRQSTVPTSVFQHDPFILAAPCWRRRVILELPPEPPPRPTREQLEKAERERIMAIRTVEASAAPQRLFIRGGISSKQDYVDLLQALNSADKSKAFVVDMDPKAWVKQDGSAMDKPEVTFANSLRRRFDASGLPVTAYMSGTMQVTVRRLTAIELKEREAGKGKRKGKK
jgi:hypothetical protein